MSKSPIPFLRHIIDEADFVIAATRDLDRDRFVADATLTRAVARGIEIIGEAVTNLPVELTSRHADVPWRQMVGMRNRLIHGYFLVDYGIVWDVARNEVPPLRIRVEQIIAMESPPGDPSSKE